PSVDGDRVLAVALLDLAQAVRRGVEGLVPGHVLEARYRPPQRRPEPVRVFVLEIALDALRAEHPAVERELLPGLEAHDLVVADLELDAALLAAEAAVRLHQPVGRTGRLLRPAPGRSVVEVRPEALGQPVGRQRRPSHGPPPSAAAAPARSPSACRRDRPAASARPAPPSGSRTRAAEARPPGRRRACA